MIAFVDIDGQEILEGFVKHLINMQNFLNTLESLGDSGPLVFHLFCLFAGDYLL